MQDPFHNTAMVDERYSVMQFCMRLWARRLTMALWGVAGAGLVAAFLLLFTQPYTAEALVRLDAERSERGIPQGINLDTEVDFIRSRSIFLLALNSLGPDVDIIRRDGGEGAPLPGQGGANVFSADQSGLTIDKLQVPDKFLNQKLTLRIEKNRHYTLFDPENNLIYSDLLEAGMPGKSGGRERKSPPVELRISNVTAKPGQTFTLIPRSPKNYLGALQDQLQIQTIGRREMSGFIRLTFSADSPVFAKRFLTALVDTYIRRAYDQSAFAKITALEKIEEQQKLNRAELEKAEQALRDFQVESGTIDMTVETQIALQQVMEVENQVRNLRSKQKELSVYYTNAHPSLQSLSDQLAYLEAERARKQGLIDRLPQTQQTLLRLKREVETLRQIFDMTNEKLTQMRNEAASITGYAKVVDAPEILPGSGLPKFIKTTMLGFFAGALLGGVYVYGRYFSPLASLRDADQVLAVSDLPVLGRLTRASPVASFWRQGRLRRSLPMVAEGEDGSRYPEFLTLVRNLSFAAFGARNTAVMVASAVGGHAPAVVAANVATLYANRHKTLLIDCGMGERGLHTLCRVASQPGLSDVIIGEAPLDRAVQTLSRNLYLLPAGTPTSYHARLLDQPVFLDMLDQLAKSFRHVVLYYPHLREDQAESALLQRVGSVVILVSAGIKTERLRRLLGAYRDHPSVKGMVLDDV